MLTNLQLHGRILAMEEMLSVTGTVDCVVEGDYLAWNEMEWDERGPATSWTTISKDDLCTRNTFVRFLPEAETHSGALR